MCVCIYIYIYIYSKYKTFYQHVGMATITTQFHVMSFDVRCQLEKCHAGDVALGVGAHVNNSATIDKV